MNIEIDEIIRKIAIFIIISILTFTIYCIIKNIPTSVIYITGEGIRIEKNSEYPNTDNPYMEGVTSKNYTAEVKQ